MTLNTQTMLTNIVYGTASGPYDGTSPEFWSDPDRAANYYGGQGSIQTATVTVTDFVGRIHLQATLNDQPTIQAAWFDVGTDVGDGTTATTETTAVTVVGNFTYMRAHVTEFTAGTINSITLTY